LNQQKHGLHVAAAGAGAIFVDDYFAALLGGCKTADQQKNAAEFWVREGGLYVSEHRIQRMFSTPVPLPLRSFGISILGIRLTAKY
jgi:hypothetical protein